MLLINHGKAVIFLRTFCMCMLYSFVANHPFSGVAFSNKLAVPRLFIKYNTVLPLKQVKQNSNCMT